MDKTKPYWSLRCESVITNDGQVETVFSGQTQNAQPNTGTTEFSGVVNEDGKLKGNFTVKDNDGKVQISANTDGSGHITIPTGGNPSLADTARRALEGPAKACGSKNLPWAPLG